MSEYAKINLIGKSTLQLSLELQKIDTYYGEKNYPVRVTIDDKTYIEDSIDNILQAVHGDLFLYIGKNFNLKGKLLKSGGNDDLYIVSERQLSKHSSESIKTGKYTHKKKKRKKNKKTHRK